MVAGTFRPPPALTRQESWLAETSPEPIALGRLAEAAGYKASDLVRLTALSASTFSRIWDDPEWLDRVDGGTLMGLVEMVPEIAAYVGRHPHLRRHQQFRSLLAEVGVEVDRADIAAVVEHARLHPSLVTVALRAALLMLQENDDEAIKWLHNCWGRQPTRGLDVLFGQVNGVGLLKDPEPVISAAERMLDRFRSRIHWSLQLVLAEVVLTHHLTKSVGEHPRWDTLGGRSPKGKREAICMRGALMGELRVSDDHDLAGRYGSLVASDHTVALVEDWAFPTWTGDQLPSDKFMLRSSLILRRTADEVVYEVEHYNEAYLAYLVKTYIPRAFMRDRSFGGSAEILAAALMERADRCADSNIATACAKLAQEIKAMPSR